MRIMAFYYRYRILALDIILLLAMLSIVWGTDNWLSSLLCGTGAGLMLYRIGERFSQGRIRKA